MNEYDYRRIINDLNNGIVKQIRFCVDNYYHYRDCKIARTKHKVNNKIQVHHIDVSLTADSSEKISFLSSNNKAKDLEKLNLTTIDYIHVDYMDGKFVKQKSLPVRELKKV